MFNGLIRRRPKGTSERRCKQRRGRQPASQSWMQCTASAAVHCVATIELRATFLAGRVAASQLADDDDDGDDAASENGNENNNNDSDYHDHSDSQRWKSLHALLLVPPLRECVSQPVEQLFGCHRCNEVPLAVGCCSMRIETPPSCC